jgi:hypothetical protein
MNDDNLNKTPREKWEQAQERKAEYNADPTALTLIEYLDAHLVDWYPTEEECADSEYQTGLRAKSAHIRLMLEDLKQRIPSLNAKDNHE